MNDKILKSETVDVILASCRRSLTSSGIASFFRFFKFSGIFQDSVRKCTVWYQNGQIHRDGDEPAIEHENGDREWWTNDLIHRDGDKPAIEDANGIKYYFKHGCQYMPKKLSK